MKMMDGLICRKISKYVKSERNVHIIGGLRD